MKVLKIIFLTITFLTTNQTVGQVSAKSVDFTKLVGKWECIKATRTIKGKTEDISKDYKPNFISYFADTKFTDEYPAGNTTISGNYSINKTTMLITYKEMTQTTKYPDAKVPMKDLIQQGFKVPLKIIKLTETEMTLLDKENELSEGPGDYYFYFKKLK